MASDPLYSQLSPQQWRVWRLMCDGEAHTIDALYYQARPLHSQDVARRKKQQVIGSIIVHINRALMSHRDCTTRAVPGDPRHTYQLRTVNG